MYALDTAVYKNNNKAVEAISVTIEVISAIVQKLPLEDLKYALTKPSDAGNGKGKTPLYWLIYALCRADSRNNYKAVERIKKTIQELPTEWLTLLLNEATKAKLYYGQEEINAIIQERRKKLKDILVKPFDSKDSQVTKRVYQLMADLDKEASVNNDKVLEKISEAIQNLRLKDLTYALTNPAEAGSDKGKTPLYYLVYASIYAGINHNCNVVERIKKAVQKIPVESIVLFLNMAVKNNQFYALKEIITIFEERQEEQKDVFEKYFGTIDAQGKNTAVLLDRCA